jgi:hypothetical protein
MEVTGHYSNRHKAGQGPSADQPTSLLDVALSCLDRLEELKALLVEASTDDDQS